MKLRDLDPKARRELNAVDAALRGERVEPEFDDLAAIAAELHEARPALDRDVTAELDAWAAEGFPRADKTPSDEGASEPPRDVRPGKSRRRWLLPAFGAAATAVLVIGVAISQLRPDGELDSGSDDAGLATIEKPQPTSPDVFESGAEKLSGRRAGLAIGEPRANVTSASLTLSAEGDEVADVADDVVDVTDRYGGIVDEANVTTGDAASPRASFQLRIPSQDLQAALADLSDLAHVKSRNEAESDVNKAFIRGEERFSDANAEVDALLEQLAEADDATEIESIRAQLRNARNELAAARFQLKEIKQRVGFSVVTVGVVAEGDGPGWSLGEAADDAVNVLEWIGGALLVALAVIIPVGALGAALWFGTANLRRRRRESVLDH